MKDEAEKRNFAVIGATALTIVWMAGAFWLLHQAAPCAETGRLFADKLYCLPINGIGDFLAGAFAPVAFLWLVTAVLLQRSELQAQRQELRETREVSREHVVEARRNVELITAQTRILEEERTYRVQRESDEQIENLLRLFRREAQDNLLSFYISHGPIQNNNLNEARNVRRFHGVGGSDDFLFIQNIARGIPDIVWSAHKFSASEIGVEFSDSFCLESAADIIAMLNQAAQTASPSMQADIARLRIDDAPAKLRGLAEFLRNNGKR